jgi:hypothetical protein
MSDIRLFVGYDPPQTLFTRTSMAPASRMTRAIFHLGVLTMIAVDRRDRLVERLVIRHRPPGDEHSRALPGELAGHASADAFRRSGNDGDSAR